MDSYNLEAHFTSVTPLGVTSHGLRLNIEFSGMVTDGPLTGAQVTGTDYLLLRPGGVGEIDIRELLIRDGVPIAAIRVVGFVVLPFPVPELTVLASSEFSWPDADLPLHGAAFFETAPADMPSVPSTVYGCVGTVNVATGTIRVAAQAITSVVSAPRTLGAVG